MQEKLCEWFDECLAAYSFRTPMRWARSGKRKAIENILRADPCRSDRFVSSQTGFSRELVAKVRRGLPAVPHRVGIDGKRYRKVKEGSISRPINASTKSEI